MIEFIRKFALKHGLTLWELRRERRIAAEMEIELMTSPGVAGGGSRLLAVGRTTDLSAGGVGVVIDSISDLHSYLALGAAPVALRIALENRILMMEVEPRLYDRLEGTPCRFAVGLMITKMSDEVGEEYAALLKTLERKGKKIGSVLLTQRAPSLPIAD